MSVFNHAASEFAGKVVVVTGVARGLGLGIATRLAGDGAHVYGLDISLPDAPAFTACNCDVSDEDAVRSTVAGIVERHGYIDVVVNNAAVVTSATPIADLSLADWNRALAVNLTGAFLVSKYCIPSMKHRAANIIHIASQLAGVSARNKAAYSASKAALVALARSMALDLAADGIRVNALSPGAIWTERVSANHESIEKANAAMASQYPLGRIANVDEIVEAVLFLASSKAAFATGSNMVLDGGYTAQ